MGRWKPDAEGRLVLAALDLYLDPGYERTTVADIAERAGVTERTFYRYFTDKREVLFAGATELEATVLAAITAAPAGQAAFETMNAAMVAGAGAMEDRRPFARMRSAAIAADTSLQERELLKLARMAERSAAALHERGVPAEHAALAAEMAVGVFKVAFAEWVGDDAVESDETLIERVDAGFARIRSLAAGY